MWRHVAKLAAEYSGTPPGTGPGAMFRKPICSILATRTLSLEGPIPPQGGARVLAGSNFHDLALARATRYRGAPSIIGALVLPARIKGFLRSMLALQAGGTLWTVRSSFA
jgi:hypothetical protein